MRANGEGSIRQRPDGRWEIRATVSGRRKSFYGQTRREAEAKRDRWMARHGLTPPTSGDETVGQWVRWAIDNNPRLAPGTRDEYERIARTQIIPHVGRIPLDAIEPAHVQSMVNALLSDGLAVTTADKARRVLSSCFSLGRKLQRVGHNPASADTIMLPPAEEPDRESLEPSEAWRLVEVVRDHQYGPVYTVALFTGLRFSELCGLCWRWVDLDEGALAQRWTLQRRGGGWLWGESKSKASRRGIPLTTQALWALRHQRKLSAERKLAAGPLWQDPPHHPDRDLVFTRPDGGPLVNSTLNRKLHEVQRGHGLPEVSLHELRHTTGSLLLAEGVPVKTVSQILGHASERVTERHYAHQLDEPSREAMDRLDRAFGG